MQAQQYTAAPMHFDYYGNIQHHSNSQTLLDQYISAPDAAPNFSDGFLRGSSFTYPHQDYRYMLDRGEPTSRLCTTSLVDNTLDATGFGFAENPSPGSSAFGAPEDIPAYQTPLWDWSGHPGNRIVAPAPVYAAPPEPTYLEKTSNGSQPSVVHTPPTQLPTPAAMAILLNPHGRSEGEPAPIGCVIPMSNSALLARQHNTAALSSMTRPAEPVGAPTQNQSVPEALSREKKHACTMCHKRFDRPSTLRKHLLVHTGEKAFVCDTCGRRFGVASNLNRHVKRCILKPVNTPSPSHKSSMVESPTSTADSPEMSNLLSSISPESTQAASVSSTAISLGKRPRPPSVPPADHSSPSSTSAQSAANGSTSLKSSKPSQKRRRRAPSPSQWIPATLQNFNLLSDDSYRITPVPLSPVRRNPPKEERDSWDENVGHSPYHPCGWSGVLPGPGLSHGLGLGGKDVRNLNLGAMSSEEGSSNEHSTGIMEAGIKHDNHDIHGFDTIRTQFRTVGQQRGPDEDDDGFEKSFELDKSADTLGT